MNTRRIIVNGVLAVAVVGVGTGGYLALHTTKTAATSTTTVVTATKGIVLSTVTGSGNVSAPSTSDVSFDSAVSSNKVTEILVKVGDKVTVGQALGRVDPTAATTALATAQAQQATAQAALDKATNPLTDDVKLQNTATVIQASNSLANAKAQLASAQRALETDTALQDQAVAQAADAVTTAQAKAELDVANAQASLDLAQATLDTDTAKQASAQTAYDAAVGTPGEAAARTALDAAKAAVLKDATALTTARNQLASSKLTTTQSVTNAQNAVVSAEANRDTKLTADQASIDSAQRGVTAAQASYNATVAGVAAKEEAPTDDDLASARAQLLSAQNAVTTAQKNLDNTTLKAPMSGTVATLNGKVGATGSSSSSGSSGSGSTGGAAAGTGSSSAFLTLTDLDTLQVKVGFSESDATNVKAGLDTTVTFDSLTGVNATGKVVQVDLTSTTVSNVVTYYAYVALTPGASLAQVRPGMTASVQVVVSHADGVVILPTAAVPTRGTTATVKVIQGDDPAVTKDTPVTIGLRGDSGVEIKSGLNAGDKVAVVRTSAAGTGSTGLPTGGLGGAGAGAGGAGGGGGGFVPTGGPPAGARPGG